MEYEYDFDSDSAQKFHNRSTMNCPTLKNDMEMCKNCINDKCPHPEYSELDWCEDFKIRSKL